MKKNEINKKLGNNCSALYSTIAKLYFADRGERTWIDTGTAGAVSFIIDRKFQNQSSFFIQIYDVKTFDVLFRQDLYMNMEYVTSNEWFHCLEIPDGLMGLSFSNASEARIFASTVRNNIFHSESVSKPILSQLKSKGSFMMDSFNNLKKVFTEKIDKGNNECE